MEEREKILKLFSDDFIRKYASENEAFNVFIAKNLIARGKYDRAIKQLEFNLSTGMLPIISYIALLIIYILQKDKEKVKEVLAKFEGVELTNEVKDVIEKLKQEYLTYNSSAILSGLYIENLLLEIVDGEDILKGWVFFNDTNRIISCYNVSENLKNYIENFNQKFFASVNNKLVEKIGKIYSLLITYENTTILYVRSVKNINMYYVGTQHLNLNYLKLKLNLDEI